MRHDSTEEEHEAPDSGLEKAARKGLDCEGGVMRETMRVVNRRLQDMV